MTRSIHRRELRHPDGWMVVPITMTSTPWEDISYSENIVGASVGRNNSTKLLQYEVKGK